MLITLLKHADRVKIACLAQLVNVIAPIMTRNNGGCWAQTIYYPFMHASKYGRGCALRTIVNCPVYDCKDYEKVPMISAVATVDDGGNVTVFCVNKDIENAYHIAMDLRSFGEMILKERIVLHHSDVNAMNTEENPYCVSPVTMDEDKLVKGIADLQVEPLSWNVFRLIRP